MVSYSPEKRSEYLMKGGGNAYKMHIFGEIVYNINMLEKLSYEIMCFNLQSDGFIEEMM